MKTILHFLLNSLGKKTNKTNLQFFKYSLAGALCTIVDFGILIILTEIFGIYYLNSVAISFLVAVALNYFLSINWIFSTRKLSDRKKEILIFFIVTGLGLFLNEFFIYFFTEVFHFHYLISKAFSTLVVLFWNFFSKKILLF